MKRKKLGKRMKAGLKITAWVALIAVPVYAEQWKFTWDHPCDDNPAATQTCPMSFPPRPCYCEADYNEENNWSSAFGGYPDQSTDDALLTHSNTGYCDDVNLNKCSANGDCTGTTCKNYEGRMIIYLIDETIAYLNIRTADTTATTEKLVIQISKLDVCINATNNGTECTQDSDCTGEGATCDQSTKVLTTDALVLDAIDGPITLTSVGGNLETR